MESDAGMTLMDQVLALELDDIEAVATRIAGDVVRTPLLPWQGEGSADRDLRLKPENLQPFGSFKVRAGLNAALAARENGGTLVTASAGNFAQGLAFAARRYGLPLHVHVPDSAAATKVAALDRLGATVQSHPFAEWWRIMETRDGGIAGLTFIHPVCEAAVVAGNATIGLEIGQDWADVETIVIPFGGGGLSTGVAMALRLMGRNVEIVACEVETSTPLTAAFAAGEPVTTERTPSFVDGIGLLRVLDEMWPLVTRFIDRTVTVSVEDCAAAVRETALRHRLIIEGAGAAAVAAAKRPEFAGRKVCAVVSGGNIDLGTLSGMIG